MPIPKPSPVHVRHAVKTALAATAAYGLTTLFDLPQAYWAVISVILVMQANLGGSIQAGVNRILGAAAGALLGAASLTAFHSSTLALGVGLGLTSLVCAYFVHLHESFRMAGLTAAIIILQHGQGGALVDYTVYRFLEISLGVAVALGFSLLVWPSRAGRLLKDGVVRALNDAAALYSVLLCCRDASSCDIEGEREAREALRATREKNLALLKEAKKEPAGLASGEHITLSLYNFTERIAEHLLSMEHAVHHPDLESLHAHVAREMDLLAQTTITAMTRLALAIAQERDPGPMDDLKRAVATAEEALARLRGMRVLPGYELEAVMRFFSYYYNMREVAMELEGMAERAAPEREGEEAK